MGLNVNTQNIKYKSEFGHVKLGNIFEKRKKKRKWLCLVYHLVYNYTTPKCTRCHLILEAQQGWAWLGPGWEDIIYKGGFRTFVNKDGFRNDMVAEVRKDKMFSITIFKM